MHLCTIESSIQMLYTHLYWIQVNTHCLLEYMYNTCTMRPGLSGGFEVYYFTM
jgi:hypothetical protein